jgi:hypothetical protein
MKLHRRLALVLALSGVLGLLGGLSANDKKTKEPDKKKKADPAKPIVVNDQWIDGDAKDKVYTNSFMKSYTFKMEKDKSYQIELQANNAQAAVRLESDKGNQLASDNDQFGNQGAAIIHRATKTEDYQIIATALNLNTNIKFTLTVKELTGDEGKPIDLKLDKGVVTFNGNLDKSDPRYSGKIHKLFLVKLEANKDYQINMLSKDMDSYLYLLSPEGAVLAQDDDGGGGDPGALNRFDSKIVHRVNKAGEYRIVATSLGGRQTANFILKVQEK